MSFNSATPFPNFEVTEDALPRVPVQDVLDIQSLAMGTVLPLARTRRTGTEPRVTGFVLLHETNPNVQHPSDVIQMPNEYGEYEHEADVDTYLGVIVRKPHPRQWRLTVSFLQYMLTEADRLTNTRDIYRFEWRRGEEEALGTRRVIRSVGEVSAADMIIEPERLSFDRTVRRGHSIERSIVTSDDCQQLRAKIAQHADFFLGIDANFTAA